ncbi:MAG: hypothetical protein JJ971_05960 [Balneolaceae bacterium]|nr:hypothetical protein [Balneolaceae bacterium]MBO6545922.1 hypothetical protein [Balneolaceae bacterium]MBO6647318.1 hypothetical protein [Balneolaceae bacterium]
MIQKVQAKKSELKQFVKNGYWEVLLTDPGLNKFNFGKPLTDKYITTDIISPLGEKSILYNTVPNDSETGIVVGLNFEEIDQTRISEILVKASDTFFEHWQVILKDNRNDIRKVVTTETVFAIEPVIELNKLMRMGFSDQNPEKSKSYFELHLEKTSPTN